MDLLGEDRVQSWRRRGTATSILDIGAQAGLLVGCVFWNNTFWVLIAPAGWVEIILSVALAGGYALILPMLLSLLAPSTAAGMALAETKYKTWGHAIAVAAAVFMVYHAFTVVWAWWRSRPAVVASEQDLFMAIGTLIIFIVVPALSWVQIAPDRWVAEVVQAQQVKRLKAAQQANLMAAQIQYARAMGLLKRGLANATALERQELAGTLIAMQRAENEGVERVADQMRILTGIDGGPSLIDDPQIERQYHQLTTAMERLYAPINDDYVELEPAPVGRNGATNGVQRGDDELQRALVAQPVAPHHSPLHPVAATNERNATVAQGDAPRRTVAHGRTKWYEEQAHDVRHQLGATLTAKQVARALDVSESQAREMVGAWQDAGWLDRTNLKGHYAWRER
jgi:hypothetical protein